ncbi:hypothetical protein F5887DRAFT_1157518 [Amanita rubescens]|nr:hypothetical protein F5887DRAFT_1157518 [Amanita rubescens]
MLNDNFISANKPFDSSAEADIILRSSDKVDFFVQKSFLRWGSPVLNEKLSEPPYERKNKGDKDPKNGFPIIPLKRAGSIRFSSSAKNRNDGNNGLPIFQLEEDNITLYNLLLLIHPYSTEPHCTIEVLLNVGKAAKKYGMEEVEEKLMKAAHSMDALTKEPFRIFAVAHRFGWVELMKEAARNTLKIPIRNLGGCDELHLLTSVEYRDLLQWLFDCRNAVEMLFAEWDSRTSPPTIWNFFAPLSQGKREAKKCFQIATDTGVVSRALAEHARKVYPGVIKSRGSAEAEIEEVLSMVPLKINDIKMSDLSSSIVDVEGIATGNITDAPKPFDSSAKRADVIICSQDFKRFYVLKSLLCLASPVFDTKFSPQKGQGGGEEGMKMPIIPFEVHSTTLYNLLLLIYPYNQKPSPTLDICFEMAKVARKYEMEDVDKKIRELITVSGIPSKEPLRVFAIAVYLEWEDVTKTAVYATLEVPLRDLGWCQEMELLSATHYHKLLQWRFKCCDAVDRCLDYVSIFIDPSIKTSLRQALKTTGCPRSGVLIDDTIKGTLMRQSSSSYSKNLQMLAENIDEASLSVLGIGNGNITPSRGIRKRFF